ncbi:hypothetical protein DXT76_19985 [Halobacillus trueperi]|uniref:Uncharacterized protein n=1 Tax=Halobacillus trueperi TaxID=156205 RepID=A0A3D8VD06_9BACI|nr:hypothetical protein DXT76_19985 [Halobacillus trueperi]
MVVIPLIVAFVWIIMKNRMGNQATVANTVFIFNLGTQATGYFLTHLPQRFLWMSAMEGLKWPRWWPIFNWSIWLAYAPITGMFLARLA